MVAPRCYFVDTDGRCRRRGYGPAGGPVFCEEHADEEYEGLDTDQIIDTLLDNPQVQKGVGKVNSLLDKLAGVIDRVAAGDFPARKPAPQMPAVKQANPLMRARLILHFGPKDVLTKELISARRKQVARLAHPDLGGSPEAMREVNVAADLLLSALK